MLENTQELDAPLQGPERKLRAFRYLAGHALGAFAVVGLLAACGKDTRQADANGCIADARQRTSQLNLPPNASAEEKHDKIGTEVAACMEEHGYRHDNGSMTDERCVEDVDYNPYCYVKKR